MSLKKQKTKDVFYNNHIYTVSYSSLKHLDGMDVVKLPNETIVYYDDFEKKWKKATEFLIESYSGKKYIDVEFNGEVIKCLSYLDMEEEIDNKKITKINVECIVTRDETSKIWKIVDKNDPMYQVYIQEKSE